MTGTRDGKERSLRSLSRASVESLALSFNSSGMLNQTGLVDRHNIPFSALPSSRSPVSGSRFLRVPRGMFRILKALLRGNPGRAGPFFD